MPPKSVPIGVIVIWKSLKCIKVTNEQSNVVPTHVRQVRKSPQAVVTRLAERMDPKSIHESVEKLLADPKLQPLLHFARQCHSSKWLPLFERLSAIAVSRLAAASNKLCYDRHVLRSSCQLVAP